MIFKQSRGGVGVVEKLKSRMVLFFNAVFFWTVAMVFLFSFSDAHAYQVKRVIKGSAVIPAGSEVLAVDLGLAEGLNLPKSFVTISTSMNNTIRNDGNIMVVLDDSQTILFSRATSVAAVNVEYFIVEFAEGVTVLSGISTVQETTYNKVVTLPLTNLDLTKSFPVITYKMLNTRTNVIARNDEYAIYSAEILNPQAGVYQLHMSRSDTTNQYNDEIAWQVIIFDRDVDVQHGTTSIASGTQKVLAAPADFTAVNAAKSLLLFTYKPNAGVSGYESQYAIDGVLTDGSTMTFNRVSSTSSIDAIKWYLLEFKNEVLAQAGIKSFTGTTVNVTGAGDGFGTGIFTDRSFAFISASGGGATDQNSLDEILVRGQISGTGISSTLVLTRETTQTTNVNVSWGVVELPLLDVILPAGGLSDTDYAGASIWQIGGNSTIEWRYSDALKTGGGGTAGVHRIKIEVSVDGGISWLQVPGAASLDVDTGTLDNIGSWTWSNIPNSIGGTNLLTRYGTAPKSKLKIKITDIEAGMGTRNFDTSNGYFIINPKFTITQPPNTWKIGETQNISWSSTGDLAGKTFTISLAADGVAFDHEIINNKDATLVTHPWAIPSKTTSDKNLIGTTNKLKITYNDDPLPPYTTVTSTGTVFTLKGQIYNVLPSSSVTWLLGENHTITWDKKGYFGAGLTDGAVDLYYSSNNGLSYDAVPFASNQPAGTDASGGSYSWTLATGLTVSSQAKIKIAKCSHPGPAHPDDSDTIGESASFIVSSSLTNNTPDAGDGTIWRYGESHNIAWTPHGDLGTVVIKYKRSSQTWAEAEAAGQYLPGAGPTDNLSAGVAEVKQTKSWQVSPPLGYDASGNVEAVTIRVGKVGSENTVYGDSQPVNLKASVSVAPPGSGDVVKVTHGVGGVTKTISWSVNGGNSSIPGKVVISLSKDDGSTWFTDLTSNTIDIGTGGNYTWTVLPAHVGTNRVKVSLFGDTDKTNGTSGVSAAFSTIPYLELTYPNQAGLPAVYVGDTIYIKWIPDPDTAPAYFDTVEIKYDTDSGNGGYGGTVTPTPIPSNNIPGGETEIGYKWQVPNVPGIVGSKVRIKVYQTGKANEVFAASSYDFSIKGTILLKNESNGGAYVWKIGDTNHYIEWDVVGDLGLVDILYALDGDQGSPSYDHTAAVDVPAATGQYQWNPIPITAIDNYDKIDKIKFKVQTKDGSISDTSDNTLTIQKKYTSVSLVAPVLYVGDEGVDLSNISWITKGCTAPPTSIKVCMAYDRNSGKGTDNTPDTADDFPFDIVSCATGTPDIAGYSQWEVPDAIGDKVRVRVKSFSYSGDVYADSADFIINGKILTVFPRAIEAAGTDTLVVGDPLPSPGVQYNKKGSIGNLKIEYLHFGNSTWNSTIISPDPLGTPNAASFAWGWQEIIGNSYLDSSGANVIDVGGTKNSKFKFTALGAGLPAPIIVETKPFQVRGKIFNVTPTNGQEFIMSSTPSSDYYIKWETSGNIGNVRVRMDYKGGRGDDNVAGTGDEYAYPVTCTNPECGGPQNAESLPHTLGASGLVWTVPNTESAEARIRVESVDNHANLADVDMRTFGVNASIRFKGGLLNVTPTGAQTPQWKVGQDKMINWDAVGSVPKVNIVLYYDNDGGPIYDYSSVIYSSDHVNPTPKPCPWTIPAGVVTEHAIVTVTSDSDPTTTASSAAEFKIKPVLHLTAPDDNAIPFVVGAQHDIKWDAPVGSAPFLKINISTDGGATWSDTDPPTLVAKGGLVTNSIDSATAGRTYTWTVPDIMTNQGVVRIYKQGDAETYDDSDSNFYVKGVFTDVYVKVNQGDPNPGTPIDLPAGTDRYVTFNFKGSMGSVDIYYTLDGDAPVPTWQLAKNAADQDAIGIAISGSTGSGSFLWRVPSNPSSKVKVKVVNTHNNNWPDVSGISSGYNSIIGSISEVQVVPDANGTVMEVSGSKTIKWKPMGGVASFNVEYRHDSSPWFNIATNIAGSVDGDYRTWSWNNIPALDGNLNSNISASVYLRVLDYVNPTKTYSESASFYTLKGKLTLLIPDNGTQVWTLGTDYNQDNVKGGIIKWNKYGNIGNLKIEFSPKGDFTDTVVLENSYSSGSDGDNAYIWPAGIKDADRKITEAGRIRISNVSAPAGTELTASSTQPFKIRPSFTSFTTPLAGATLDAKSANKSITWVANAGTEWDNIAQNFVNPKVNLDYLIGGSPTSIATDLECVNGSNTYVWPQVADAKSDSVDIRVSWKKYSTHNPLSRTIKIYPKLTVSEPLTSVVLDIGNSDPDRINLIKWTRENTSTAIAQVDIYYDLANGSGGYPVGQKINSSPIDASVGQYSWDNVPASAMSDTVRIKVKDVDDLTDAYFGQSPDGGIKVIGKLSLSSPDGTPWLIKKNTYNIVATATAVDNVTAYYKIGAGSYTLIGSAAVSGGTATIPWNSPSTPDNVSDSVEVKVVKTGEAAATALVHAERTISLYEDFTNITLDNGPIFNAGASTTIHWDKLGDSCNEKVYLSVDNGVTWTYVGNPIKTTTDTSARSIDWTIPSDVSSTQCRLKLVSTVNAGNESILAASPTFTIRNIISVTSPNATTPAIKLGDDANDDLVIKWSYTGPAQRGTPTVDIKVKIEYSPTGDFVTPGAYYTVAPDVVLDDPVDTYGANTGYFNWQNIPTNTALGKTGKIKVTDNGMAGAVAATGTSTGNLEIRGGITMAEISGAPLKVGDHYNLSWTPIGSISQVNLYYWKSAAWQPFAANPVSATPPYDWVVDDVVAAGVKIKVEDKDNSSTNDETLPFEVIGKITIGRPTVVADGAVWEVNHATPITVEWTPVGTYTTVKIQGSRNGFLDELQVFDIKEVPAGATGVPQSTTFTVPDQISTALNNIKIRVADKDRPAVNAVSSDSFTIKGKLTVTTPVVTWYVGDTNRTIQWNATGKVGNVKIDYFDGSSIQPVIASTPTGADGSGAGSYPWPAVGDAKGDNCYLQITAVNNPTGDVTIPSGTFNIYPKLTCSEPLTTSTIDVGSNNANFIKWSRNGSNKVQQVNIYYDLDGGSGLYPPAQKINATPVDASLGKYNWDAVPTAAVSNNVRIKIQDVDDATGAYYAESPAPGFKVIGKISSAVLNQTPVFISKTGVYSIDCSASVVSKITAYYSLQNGGAGTYQVIGSADVVGGNASIPWNTPDNVSNTVMIKVVKFGENVDTAVVYKEITTFALLEEFTNIALENGPSFSANDSTTITWTSLGTSLTKVKLFLSTNNGGDGYPIQIGGAGATYDNSQGGSVPWAIPTDVRSTQCKIKVQSDINNNNFGLMGSTFLIKNRITVTNPTIGTPPWSVGNTTPYVIQWSYMGPSTTTIKIEYSSNGDAGPFVLLPGVPGAAAVSIGSLGVGSFDWYVDPSTVLTTNGKIKVTDVGIPLATGTSSGTLKVIGNVVPNEIAGAPLKIGDPYNITWSLFGNVLHVNMYYSINGDGGPWVPINTGANLNWDATVQPYPWQVPDVISDNFKIKIEDGDNPSVSTITVANNVKVIGKLVLDSPDINEPDWVIGGPAKQIKFTPTGKFAVKIEGSRNGFADENQNWTITTIPSADITSGVQKVFDYDIGDYISATVKIRVSDDDAARFALGVTDKSTNTFRIIGKLVLTHPEGADTLSIDTPFNIEWMKYGSIPSVIIQYSTDGSQWTDIETAYPNSPGLYTTYPWTPINPDLVTDHAYIRVMDSNEVYSAAVVDQSNPPFVIKGWFECKLTDAPTPGVVWEVGQPHTITWTKHGNIANVKIDYAPDGTTYGNVIASTPNSGSVSWTPTTDLPLSATGTGKLRISDVLGTCPPAISNAFKLVGVVTLISPTGGQTYTVGQASSPTIDWRVTGLINTVHISYSTNTAGAPNFNNVIVASTGAGGGSPISFPWPISDTPSPKVVVRVADTNNLEVCAKSSEVTPIKIQCAFNIVSPLSGWTWEVGSAQYIDWDTTAGTAPFVKLDYTIVDNPLSEDDWSPIVASTVNPPIDANGLLWPGGVANAISSTCKIRVSDTRDLSANKVSNNFRIRSGFLLKTPNGGVDLNPGTQYNITWDKKGTVSTVKLEYSIDGGVTYPATADTPYLPNNPIVTGLDVTGCTNNCSYNWTVPDVLLKKAFFDPEDSPAKVRVRVVNENPTDPSSDESNADNIIKSVLAIQPTSFTAGETLEVGSDRLVEWTSTGTLSSVLLQYSIDASHTSWSPVIENEKGTPNDGIVNSDGSFLWNIPNSISNTVMFRVSSGDAVNEPATAGLSPEFKVKGSLTLVDPNILYADDNYTITWTKTGSIASVKLQYKVGAGSFGDISGAGAIDTTGVGPNYTFDWAVPPIVNNSVVVRVVNNADPLVLDETLPFKIAAALKVAAPNGGVNQYYEVDGACSITWERHGNVAEVDLYYDTNSGLNNYPNPINTGGPIPATPTSYSWNPVPNAIGKLVRIKIVDHAYNGTDVFTRGDTSDADFEIRGKLEWDTVSTAFPSVPLNESWSIDSQHALNWIKHGSISNVKLQYSVNGGAYQDISGATSLTGTSFNWTIPQSANGVVTLKVINLADPDNVQAVSPAFIVRGSFTWIYPPPVGGESWLVGSEQTLRWSTSGAINNIVIKYSTDYNPGTGSGTWKNVSAGAILNNGFLDWPGNVPSDIAYPVYLKIYDSADPDTFKIVGNCKIRGSLTLTAPNGTLNYKVGQPLLITWDMIGNISTVKLEYSKNGVDFALPNGDTIIASTNAGPGKQYNWPAIPSGAQGDNIVIRITDTNPNFSEVSNTSAQFDIKPNFIISSPVLNETWTVDALKTISWTTVGTAASVDLYYYSEKDSQWKLITTSGAVVNNNTYPDWPVADDLSDVAKIRVQKAGDPDAYSDSEIFKIRGTITLTSPVGGEKWFVGSQQQLTWDQHGSFPKVNINYWDGSFWRQIKDSEGNADITNYRNFDWIVPDQLVSTSRIQITGVGYAYSTNISPVAPAGFKIMGGFTVSNPSLPDGYVVIGGANRTINWTSSSVNVPSVRIDYSTDNGATYPYNIATSVANTGMYTPWEVPVTVSNNVKIRVCDVLDYNAGTGAVDAFGESPAFMIYANFAVVRPNNGTEKLVAGRNDNNNKIQWTCLGNLANVRLQYTLNGSFALFTANQNVISGGLVPNNPDQDGISSYVWSVPNNFSSDTVKIRVSDPDNYYARDDSDNNFRIIAGFTVLSPNGDNLATPGIDETETFNVGGSYNITWDSSSSVPTNVTIDYSINGGGSWDPIPIVTTDNSLGSGNAFLWTDVRNTISSDVRIRVRDAVDATAFDISDRSFIIRAKFDVTYPDGGQTFTVGQPCLIEWDQKGTVSKVKLEYSKDGSNWNLIEDQVPTNPDGNGHCTRPWLGGVSDVISSNVRIRVSDADIGHPAASDVSLNTFRVKGALSVTSPKIEAPATGVYWEIGRDNLITWDTTGSIDAVKIIYSTTGTFNSPTDDPFIHTINASAPNTGINKGKYTWNVDDTAAAAAKIRIIDASVGNDDVISESDPFHIRGYFDLTSPDGGEEWIVGQNHTISWQKGGTIGYKLTYSIDGTSFPVENVIVVKPDPADNLGTFSWPVSNNTTLTKTAKIKIEDPADSDVYDISLNNFAFHGGLNLTSPNGVAGVDDRWVTNESRTITWQTTAGTQATMPYVKIEYSIDSDHNTWTPIVESEGTTPDDGIVTNDGSFSWIVPNNRSTTVKVRVSDASNSDVKALSTNNFKIDYYQITWIARDLLTNETIASPSVNEKSATDSNIVNWNETLAGTPIVHDTPYGSWVTTWSASGYGDKPQTFVADSDQSFTVYLETTAVHIWRAYSEFSYSADDNFLNVSSWLERDGSVVTGAVNVDVKIYDGSTLIKTLSSNAVNAAGFFVMTWADTTLEEGKVYVTIAEITNASGAKFKTPTSFSITEAKRLKGAQDAVEDMRDITLPAFQTSVSNLITTKLDTQQTLITTKMDEQKQIITDKTNEMVSSVNTTLTAFETKSDTAIKKLQSGADQAVQAGAELEATAKKYSWNASVSPNPALTGDLLSFNLQGQPGLSPMLDIYSYDNKPIMLDQPMKEVQDGLYVFEVIATKDKFTPGKAFTYVATEQVTSGLVSGSGIVESTSITSIAGLAASAPEAARTAKEVLDAVTALQNVLISDNPINISMALTNLQDSVDSLPEAMAKESGGTAQARVLNEVSEKLNTLIGKEGIDLSSMLEDALEENPTIKEIRGKTDAIQGVIKLLQQLFEAKFGGFDTPVVSTSLAPGSVKFRIAVANPSKTKVQTVPVKIYLPEEVKPKDIMDMGGLNLEYDQNKSIYYVYSNEVELNPLESRLFEVEVEDIWFILKPDLDSLRKQSEVIVDRLKDTDYYEAARTIAGSIYERIDKIIVAQADEAMSREQHIGLYRNNLQVVEKIKEDISKMEKLLVAVGGPPEPSMLKNVRIKSDSPSRKVTWIVVFIIMIFIGLLAAVFFFTWNSQVKFTDSVLKQSKKEAFPERKSYDIEEGDKKT